MTYSIHRSYALTLILKAEICTVYKPDARAGPSNTIFLLTGLRIYMGEYKAQGLTLCPTEGRALRGPRALYSPV